MLAFALAKIYTMEKAIPYYRVSTDKQGVSGLGLDAQKQAVRDFARFANFQLLNEFIEVETGSNSNRPVLQKVLRKCKQHGAILLIAKLDRLARDVAFISSLMKSKTRFIAVDNPTANELMLHIMAAFSEYERRQISQRTKDALAAAKKRGVVLGANGRNVLSKRNRDNADKFALTMKPTIDELRKDGHKTVRDIVSQLNKKKVRTYHKGKWHINTVYSLLKRIESLTI